jgi:hypothetical protein
MTYDVCVGIHLLTILIIQFSLLIFASLQVFLHHRIIFIASLCRYLCIYVIISFAYFFQESETGRGCKP